MEGQKFSSVVLVLAGLCFSSECLNGKRQLQRNPAYGFTAVERAFALGRSLRFSATLAKCTQVSGPITPEFTTRFGDYLYFYLGTYVLMDFNSVHLAYNNTGGLVRVVRSMTISSTNTVEVRTEIFTPDFGFFFTGFTHNCQASTSTSRGGIDFYQANSNHTIIRTFTGLVDALVEGADVHFVAVLGPCSVEPPQTLDFPFIGGFVRDYDYVVTSFTEKVDVVIGTTVRTSDHMLHVHTMEIYSNHEVLIRRTTSHPPELDTRDIQLYHCAMEIGAPGGSVSFYSISP